MRDFEDIDGLPKSARVKPFGGGMPDLMTAKARQFRQTFEDRLERLSQQAMVKPSK